MNTKEHSKTIRSILEEFAKYCTVNGTPFGSMPNDKERLGQALAEIEEVMNECKPEFTGCIDCNDSASNQYQSNLHKALGKE